MTRKGADKNKTKRRRRFNGGAKKKVTEKHSKWGDMGVCDHILMKDWLNRPGVDGCKDLLTYLDLATRTKYAVPVDSKEAFETVVAICTTFGSFAPHLVDVCSIF